MIYLTQFLAQSKIGSRRQAEKLIRQNKVKVNDKLANLGDKVEGTEKITVSNKELNINRDKKTKVLMLNKPEGYTCTKKSFSGEKNIYSLLPKKFNNYIIVGRLDKNSQGLLLLSNNGFFANKVSHPKYNVEKKYLIHFANQDKLNLNPKKLYAKIKTGVKTKEGEVLKAKNIQREENNWFVTLEEGKKRHIRRLFMAIGLKVVYLKRISIGNLDIKNLAQSKYKILSDKEINKIFYE